MFVCVPPFVYTTCTPPPTMISANQACSRHLSLSLSLRYTHTRMPVPPSWLFPKSVQIAASQHCVPKVLYAKVDTASSNIFTTLHRCSAIFVCNVLCVARKHMEVLMSETLVSVIIVTQRLDGGPGGVEDRAKVNQVRWDVSTPPRTVAPMNQSGDWPVLWRLESG